ncbi:hypothetical protein [Endozoicomonas sp. Mp262]|uniref:hypothetical protein n=1 Tax=Endozoicomonas sp. Mp262 TaxID=2919499 RepID=UPI0021D9C0BF
MTFCFMETVRKTLPVKRYSYQQSSPAATGSSLNQSDCAAAFFCANPKPGLSDTHATALLSHFEHIQASG